MSTKARMLHTVNKSPFERDALKSCFRLAGKGSAILLIEDAVYAALDGTAVSTDVKAQKENFNIFVLGPDLEARGLSGKPVIDGVSVVDYSGFVDLVAEHESVQSWL